MEPFAKRLKRIMTEKNFTQADVYNGAQPLCKERGVVIRRNYICQYLQGEKTPGRTKSEILAEVLGVSAPYLMGFDDKDLCTEMPVLADIPASFEQEAVEAWISETIEIPNGYFRGHSVTEFAVIRVSGDSMAPKYESGDLVLLRRQSMVNNGDVAVCYYGGERTTLKRVYFNDDEESVTLKPINTCYEPIELKGEQLSEFRIYAKPIMMLRRL